VRCSRAQLSQGIAGRVILLGLLLLALFGAFRMGQLLSGRFGSCTDKFGTAIVRSKSQSEPDSPWVEIISWSPRVFVYHHFLTDEECDHVIELGKPHISASEVVGADGKAQKSTARTSQGAAMVGKLGEDEVVQRLEQRIAEWTHLPRENGESFYIIRYEAGQQYIPHFDYFPDDNVGRPWIGKAGNRMATVLLYLHAPDDGGETYFPSKDIVVKGRRGDAILFYDSLGDGAPDPLSLHGGKPVLKGHKWVMTKWIRARACC